MFAATHGSQPTRSRPTPVTTNRNNLNLLRIFSFRAKLQTPQSVSMPSCAIMKPNRGCFREGNKKPLKFSGSKTGNSFPFNKAPKKTAPFSAVFRASSQPHLCCKERCWVISPPFERRSGAAKDSLQKHTSKSVSGSSTAIRN